MTTYTYTGNQYTNIPATTGTTFGPADLVGGNTSTAANNITNDAKRVTIMTKDIQLARRIRGERS